MYLISRNTVTSLQFLVRHVIFFMDFSTYLQYSFQFVIDQTALKSFPQSFVPFVKI